MDLSSWTFLLFLVIMAVTLRLLPAHWHWPALLAAGYVFVLWRQPLTLIPLFLATALIYIGSRKMADCQRPGQRRLYLLACLGLTLIVFFAGKYFSSAGPLMAAGKAVAAPAMLMGTSFFSLQLLGYASDVYFGRQEAERHFGRFALFGAFFPILTSGPIERAANLLPQFRSLGDEVANHWLPGGRRILWGFFKKMVLANTLAAAVAGADAYRGSQQNSVQLLALVLYAFQLYCDFSAYSDIAVGAARLLGIRLMENFQRPYLATSVSQFWTRWHISLSSWLRDYIFLPISYAILRQRRQPRTMFMKSETFAALGAVLATMTLAGLWHGIRATFIFWGLIVGTFLACGLLTRKWRRHMLHLIGLQRIPLYHAGQTLFTFSCICFSWIFFRATSVPAAITSCRQVYAGLGQWLGGILPNLFFRLDPTALRQVLTALGISRREGITIACGLVLLLAVELFQGKHSPSEWLAEKPVWLRWATYYFLIFLVLFFGKFQVREFLYARF